MKKIYLSCVISMLCFIFSVQTNAQTRISYAYDEAGNRTKRTILLDTRTLQSAKDTAGQKPKIFKENMGDVQITIYPNPTRGQLLVKITGYDEETLSGLYLYNLSGTLLVSKSVTGSDLLELSAYPVGTYVLKIVLGKSKSEWKIMKE